MNKQAFNLVRYDYVKGCFVLAGEKKTYWPGTNVVKSTGNVFDWRKQQPQKANNETRIP